MHSFPVERATDGMSCLKSLVMNVTDGQEHYLWVTHCRMKRWEQEGLHGKYRQPGGRHGSLGKHSQLADGGSLSACPWCMCEREGEGEGGERGGQGEGGRGKRRGRERRTGREVFPH